MAMKSVSTIGSRGSHSIMKPLVLLCFVLLLVSAIIHQQALADDANLAAKKTILFAGQLTSDWECRDGAWIADADGSLTCQMEEVTQKNGKKRQRGMGYIWTRSTYSDFILEFEYKLTTAANSGVFFRTDPSNPVQGGFEIQLLDDIGVQESGVKLDPKKQNAAFYDCQAPAKNAVARRGEWNHLRLICRGTLIRVELNGEVVNQFDLQQWGQPGRNPDGSANKFQDALAERPDSGRIGFQNHGKPVSFRNVTIIDLSQS